MLSSGPSDSATGINYDLQTWWPHAKRTVHHNLCIVYFIPWECFTYFYSTYFVLHLTFFFFLTSVYNLFVLPQFRFCTDTQTVQWNNIIVLRNITEIYRSFLKLFILKQIVELHLEIYKNV